MFVLPEKMPGAKTRIPWFSAGFVMVVLLFLVIWRHDPVADEQRLFNIYDESGLFSQEWAIYPSWLRLNGQLIKATRLEKLANDGVRTEIFRAVALDPVFADQMQEEADRYWSEQEIRQWRERRSQFENAMKQAPAFRFGLVPAARKPISFATMHMLNPGYLHAILAILVLAPFALVLEDQLRTLRVAVVTTVAVLFSTLVAIAWLRDTYAPLYSSSVVVSALTGIYLGFFLKKPVSVLVPDFRERKLRKLERTLPAWTMALGWLLLPMVTVFSPVKDLVLIQVLALAAGAIMIQLALTSDIQNLSTSLEERDTEDPVTKALGKAWTAMGIMAFTDARHQFEKVLKEDPENFSALTGLYQVQKLQPDSAEFSATATRLFQQNLEHPADCRQQLMIHQEHAKLWPDLTVCDTTRWQLIINFCRIGATSEAEKLIQPGDKEKPSTLQSAAMSALARAFSEKGNQAKAGHYQAAAKRATQQGDT